MMTASAVPASTVLVDNVYMLEMGNGAATAKNAWAVRACTLAPAAKAVLGGHVKMTTRTARVIARSACLLIATIPARTRPAAPTLKYGLIIRIVATRSIVWSAMEDFA